MVHFRARVEIGNWDKTDSTAVILEPTVEIDVAMNRSFHPVVLKAVFMTKTNNE